jgi:hypothetical protein
MALYPGEQIGALKPQDPAWATGDTFSTGQALAVANRLSQPGKTADIQTNRAVIRTYPALHTARRVWNDKTGRKRLTAIYFVLKQVFEHGTSSAFLGPQIRTRHMSPYPTLRYEFGRQAGAV